VVGAGVGIVLVAGGTGSGADASPAQRRCRGDPQATLTRFFDAMSSGRRAALDRIVGRYHPRRDPRHFVTIALRRFVPTAFPASVSRIIIFNPDLWGGARTSVGTIQRFDVRHQRRDGLLALARIGRDGGRFELLSAVGAGSVSGASCVLGGWFRQSGRDGASRDVRFKAIVTWPVATVTLFSD
jgi:hypothetical protein